MSAREEAMDLAEEVWADEPTPAEIELMTQVLASDWLARHDTAIGERIADAIEFERDDKPAGLPDNAIVRAYQSGLHEAARIARSTEALTYDGFGAPIVEEGL